MTNSNFSAEYEKLSACLSGSAVESIKGFCQRLPDLPNASYANALLGMGYLYEAFDLMFATITCNIQATADESDYRARYRTVQNVLGPFSSEYGIEPDRPLQGTHRKLFADFYQIATGEAWPSHYPASSGNPWLKSGRYWSNVMLSNLRCNGLGPLDTAKYNLGYHWAVEVLSIFEFNQLQLAWHSVGVDAPYISAHCSVEPEHADCATAAVAVFGVIDDPIVHRGVRDHENDLAGFYKEAAELIASESSALKAVTPNTSGQPQKASVLP